MIRLLRVRRRLVGVAQREGRALTILPSIPCGETRAAFPAEPTGPGTRARPRRSKLPQAPAGRGLDGRGKGRATIGSINRRCCDSFWMRTGATLAVSISAQSSEWRWLALNAAFDWDRK